MTENPKEDNARVAYEYTQKAYDTVSDAQTYRIGHAYKLILVQAALFAALASGQIRLQASIKGVGEHLWVLWPIELIGASGAVGGACAFWIALRFVCLQDTAIPNTRRILEQSKGSGLDAMKHAEVVKALTRATARATQANLDHEHQRVSQAESLNTWLNLAFILTVVFVAACYSCGLLAALSANGADQSGVVRHNNEEDLTMGEENKQEEKPADQPAEQPTEQQQGERPEGPPSADVLDAEPEWMTRAKTERLHEKRSKGA